MKSYDDMSDLEVILICVSIPGAFVLLMIGLSKLLGL